MECAKCDCMCHDHKDRIFQEECEGCDCYTLEAER